MFIDPPAAHYLVYVAIEITKDKGISQIRYIKYTEDKIIQKWRNCRYDNMITYKFGTYGAAIILAMVWANERRRYIVTSSLIGWAHTQNDPWWWGSHMKSGKISQNLEIIWYCSLVLQLICNSSAPLCVCQWPFNSYHKELDMCYQQL